MSNTRKEKEGFWKISYECSVCGEISKINSAVCPFCKAHLINHRFETPDTVKEDLPPTYYEFIDDIENSSKYFRYL